jgi:hypothetical protein
MMARSAFFNPTTAQWIGFLSGAVTANTCLQKYLPFWIASVVDRGKILLLPALTLLLPLFRVAPPLYRWRIRSRIYRWL